MQRTFYAEQAALQAEVDAVGRDGPFKLRHGYRKPCASGNDVFDVPGSNLIYADDVFLDVLESPRVLELVLHIIGQDVSAVEYSARTVPPDGEGGYTEWSVSLCVSISLSFSVALTLCVLSWSQASRLRKCLRLAASGLARLRLRLTHRYVCVRARASGSTQQRAAVAVAVRPPNTQRRRETFCTHALPNPALRTVPVLTAWARVVRR